MSNYVEQLQEVKKLLTKNTWNKGNYFSVKNDTLCFCPHGAAQAVCNPEVKNIFVSGGSASGAVWGARSRARSRSPAANVVRTALRASAAVGVDFYNNFNTENILHIWNNREEWIKADYIVSNINYGNLDLHYLMGMVGLTVNFADHHDTTLEMIYEKLDRAIEIAKIIDKEDFNYFEDDKVNKEIYHILRSNGLLINASPQLQKWASKFEEQEKEKLKKQALAKLTPEEIKALGI